MSGRNAKRKGRAVEASAIKSPGTQLLTFGEPEPVLNYGAIMECLECVNNGIWYEPPVDFDGLARLSRATPHHGSALFVKRNILASTFIPHPLLSRGEFNAWALDYLVYGNGYLELRRNMLGEPLQLRRALALLVRRGVKPGMFYALQRDELSGEGYYTFPRDSVFQLLEPDLFQEVYGLPQYLCGINSILLNESATLFRRKYYDNGTFMGSVFYLTDAVQNQTDIDKIKETIESGKGRGNFKSMFLYAPNGNKEGLQIMPLAQMAAKDEFLNVKNTTRDDELSVHRVPPQLMGIIPNNTGGFGSVTDASEVFVRNELVPLQERMCELNDWLGIDVIRFSEYILPGGGDANNPFRR
ncbi:phage portal protein [Enterobacter ludwigii]|uniref:phage portal protein n=1 Tax=Enterobacter ludwigii TaxID=299767 RepID=UPI00243333BC|nr:phage portal protein [Enterobacter ludwigii]WGA02977.1 phage portal protein [Enterobacter ludwigii]